MQPKQYDNKVFYLKERFKINNCTACATIKEDSVWEGQARSTINFVFISTKLYDLPSNALDFIIQHEMGHQKKEHHNLLNQLFFKIQLEETQSAIKENQEKEADLYAVNQFLSSRRDPFQAALKSFEYIDREICKSYGINEHNEPLKMKYCIENEMTIKTDGYPTDENRLKMIQEKVNSDLYFEPKNGEN